MRAARIGWTRAAAAGAVFVVMAGAGAAEAQMPPSSETAAITSCLCLQHAMATLSGEMKAKTGALDEIRHQLADLDAELAREKPKVDVDNPNSVARFKALLDRRDAAYSRSVGPVVSEAREAVTRYNQRVGEYNRDCANRPFDAALLKSVEAALVCPPMP